jgi:hypothetical protein
MRIFALLVAFYFGLAQSLRHVLSSEANQFRGNDIEITVFRDSYVNAVKGRTLGSAVGKNVSDEPIKVVIVYTTSGSDSHMKCLCKHPKLNQRTGTPLLLRNADVILHDNGGAGGVVEDGFQDQGSAVRVRSDPEERKAKAQKCMSKFHGAKKLLYMTSTNVGYKMGAVQAMDTLMHSGELQKYDWVVHMHPDVFVAYPQPLAKMLLKTKASVVATQFSMLLMDAFFPPGQNRRGLAFDFFAFRPKATNTNAFSQWASYQRCPELYLEEVAFPHATREYVPHRYASSCKTWDEFGIWHVHTHLHRINKFMKGHPSVGVMPPWIPQQHGFDGCSNYLQPWAR